MYEYSCINDEDWELTDEQIDSQNDYLEAH
jgi:hypothetical protein